MSSLPDNVVQGEIRIMGTIHGGAAINAMLVPYEDPEQWEMKQFITQQQLERFASEHNLVIVHQEK